MAPRMTRSQEITTERRRRWSEGMDGMRSKLHTAGVEMDPAYEYRWANDDGGRIHELTVTDMYETVQSGDGTVTRQVGTKADNSPLMAVLVRKRRDFCEEDRAAKRKSANEPLRALQAARRGDQAGGAAMYVAADAQIGDD